MIAASAFTILPAIDLRGGLVVRLRQGDFAQETAYSDDPVDVASGFAESGAEWLHVVDLDGARAGAPMHGAVIEAIVSAVGDRTRVEVAGGLRDQRAIAAMLDAGAARGIVGTSALRDPTFAGRLVVEHGPDRIGVAIDVRDGRAIGQGWSRDAQGVDPAKAIQQLADVGVTTFEVTAIDRDGLLMGPDLELYERLVALGRGSVIASGGIATLDDIAAVCARGCAGAIVGRALYEGRFDLGTALGVGRRADAR